MKIKTKNTKTCPICKGRGELGSWDDVHLGTDGPPEKCYYCNGKKVIVVIVESSHKLAETRAMIAMQEQVLKDLDDSDPLLRETVEMNLAAVRNREQ